MKIAVWFEETSSNRNLFGFLLGLFGQKDSLDVGQDTSLGDGHASEELVELFVVPDRELDVPGDYPGALVVLGGVACELEQLSGEVSNQIRRDSVELGSIRGRLRGRRGLRHQLDERILPDEDRPLEFV